jgi:hypothetical protein
VFEIIEDTHKVLNKKTDLAVNKKEDDPIDIDGFKGPCKGYDLIGVYEGGGHYAGQIFRPSGLCKMRSGIPLKGPNFGFKYGSHFCHVCKYLIVHRVDPGVHSVLDREYYPEAR